MQMIGELVSSVQTREEKRSPYRVFGQGKRSNCGAGTAEDKVGSLDSAPVAESRARDAAVRTQLKRFDDRIRCDVPPALSTSCFDPVQYSR